jgi:hypothetical protein
MITASQILEEYKTSFRIGSNYIEIFSNPSKKELLSCGDEIRFTADADKKEVYVWDGNLAIHDDANKTLGYGGLWFKKPILTGIAQKEGSTYYAYRSDELESINLSPPGSEEFLTKLLSYDWDFVNRYINIKDLLQILSIKLQDYKKSGTKSWADTLREIKNKRVT